MDVEMHSTMLKLRSWNKRKLRNGNTYSPVLMESFLLDSYFIFRNVNSPASLPLMESYFLNGNLIFGTINSSICEKRF